MANNRLWIVDDETGERILIAKSFGTGWYVFNDREQLDAWLEGRDVAASFGNCSEMGPTRLRLETEVGVAPPKEDPL